jgi:hypothetical protein
MKIMILTLSCALAFPAIASAKNAQAKVTPTQVRRIAPSVEIPRSALVLRQDLFDRNNPNNLRSDWPVPPAQPGQF